MRATTMGLVFGLLLSWALLAYMASTTRDAYGSAWLSLHYPTDFAGAGNTGAGVYTVVWETRGLVLCDGFKVEAS